MDSETATLPQLAAEYASAISAATKFAFLVRDTELQLEQVNALTALKIRIRQFKYGAIQARDEETANILFHMQCGLNAEISFLRMWVQLKEADYYAAWDSLIDAQQYVALAMRAAETGVGLEDFLDRLRRTEDVVFPGFRVYQSWGAVIRGGKCSICDKPFGQCEHIEDLVYWGRLCVRQDVEIVEMDHVGMVDEPRDRRCIITELTTDDGYYRDYMTWKRTRKAEEKTEGVAGRFTGRIFCNELIEID
jgi:hypothetical protein